MQGNCCLQKCRLLSIGVFVFRLQKHTRMIAPTKKKTLVPIQPLHELVELNQTIVVSIHVSHACRQIVSCESQPNNFVVQSLELGLVKRSRPAQQNLWLE